MFTLIMIYCLAGQPCETEAVAHFPQWDVGEYVCNIAKPAIEADVRRRVQAKRATAKLTFKCLPEDQVDQIEIPQAHVQPQGNVTFYNDGSSTQELIDQGFRILEQFKR